MYKISVPGKHTIFTLNFDNISSTINTVSRVKKIDSFSIVMNI